MFLTPLALMQENESVLASDDVFSTLEFSRFMDSRLGEINLRIPSDLIKEAYEAAVYQIDQGHPISPFLANFATKGLEHIKASIESFTGQGYPTVGVSAHTANALRDLLTRLSLTHFLPVWWPKTFLEDAPPSAGSRFIGYWVWSSLKMDYVPHSQLASIKSAIVEFQQDRVNRRRASTNSLIAALSTNQSPAHEDDDNPSKRILRRNLQDIATKKGISVEQGVVQEPAPVVAAPTSTPTPAPVSSETLVDVKAGGDNDPHFGEFEFQTILQKQLNSDVQLSLFAARRYLNKVQNALERGIEFNMTVEDFVGLMRKRVCHFSGAPLTIELTKEQISKRNLPDNYLTFDRVDPKRGYTRDNVVVAAWSVNNAKSRLGEVEFRQLVAAMQLVQTLTPEQRAAMKQLSGFMQE